MVPILRVISTADLSKQTIVVVLVLLLFNEIYIGSPVHSESVYLIIDTCYREYIIDV